MDERGNLRITDRMKDMYIVGGFNAYPAEIENMILAHPRVSQVAVVGDPRPPHGRGRLRVRDPAPRHSEVDPDELIAWCREQMANYKVPRRVEIVDEFPLNSTGKVMKDELTVRRCSRRRDAGFDVRSPPSATRNSRFWRQSTTVSGADSTRHDERSGGLGTLGPGVQ